MKITQKINVEDVIDNFDASSKYSFTNAGSIPLLIRKGDSTDDNKNFKILFPSGEFRYNPDKGPCYFDLIDGHAAEITYWEL